MLISVRSWLRVGRTASSIILQETSVSDRNHNPPLPYETACSNRRGRMGKYLGYGLWKVFQTPVWGRIPHMSLEQSKLRHVATPVGGYSKSWLINNQLKRPTRSLKNRRNV